MRNKELKEKYGCQSQLYSIKSEDFYQELSAFVYSKRVNRNTVITIMLKFLEDYIKQKIHPKYSSGTFTYGGSRKK